MLHLKFPRSSPQRGFMYSSAAPTLVCNHVYKFCPPKDTKSLTRTGESETEGEHPTGPLP